MEILHLRRPDVGGGSPSGTTMYRLRSTAAVGRHVGRCPHAPSHARGSYVRAHRLATLVPPQDAAALVGLTAAGLGGR